MATQAKVWAFTKADGKAKGSKGWRADHNSNASTCHTGLWRGDEVVALLVSKMSDSDMDFDDSTKRLRANGEMLVEAANNYDAARDLLLRLADVVEALDGTNEENEKLVDDYRAFFAK